VRDVLKAISQAEGMEQVPDVLAAVRRRAEAHDQSIGATEAAVVSAHAWHDEGRSDLGEPRSRCRYCGVMAHWPLAEDACTSARRAGIQRSSKRKAYARKRPQPSSGVWAGPYREGEASRECRRCAATYRRPVTMTRCEFCGPLCAWEAARTSQMERWAKQRERRTAASRERRAR
jgi:hypothetical protein